MCNNKTICFSFFKLSHQGVGWWPAGRNSR